MPSITLILSFSCFITSFFSSSFLTVSVFLTFKLISADTLSLIELIVIIVLPAFNPVTLLPFIDAIFVSLIVYFKSVEVALFGT